MKFQQRKNVKLKDWIVKHCLCFVSWNILCALFEKKQMLWKAYISMNGVCLFQVLIEIMLCP